MSDVKRSGNKSSWTMKCAGKNPMSGQGEVTATDGSYSGTMKMKGMQEGQPVDMAMAYSGKRIGSCTYEAPLTKMSKVNDAAIDRACQEALAAKTYAQFLQPDCSAFSDPLAKEMCEKRSCSKLRPQMCEKLSGELNSSKGFKEIAKDKAARTLAEECNLPYAKVAADFCRKQVESKDFTALIDYCEKEAKGLFDQHCAGRDFTAAMDSGYGPICSHFARPGGGDASEEAAAAGSSGGNAAGMGRVGKAAGARTNPGMRGMPAGGAGMNAEQLRQAQEAMEQMQNQQNQQNPNPSPNAAESVLENAKKLKGMFGF